MSDYEGMYAIREIRTGEIKLVRLACDPNDVDLLPDQELIFRQGGEWVAVLQKKVNPFVQRLNDIAADLLALADDMEEEL